MLTICSSETSVALRRIHPTNPQAEGMPRLLQKMTKKEILEEYHSTLIWLAKTSKGMLELSDKDALEITI
jgi:hypothetical protein